MVFFARQRKVKMFDKVALNLYIKGVQVDPGCKYSLNLTKKEREKDEEDCCL
jgi:hypothetical protein